MLNDEELKIVHFYTGQRLDTRKSPAHKISKTKYAMVKYEKLKRIISQIDENRLLMRDN